MNAKLIRFEMTDKGSVGLYFFEGLDFCCFTLEPDKDEKNKLYIPQGEYVCSRFHGTKWKNTFEILVPEHSAVLHHSGNTEVDTLGCLLLGSSIGKLVGDRAVLNSGDTFKKYLDFTTGFDLYKLRIIDQY